MKSDRIFKSTILIILVLFFVFILFTPDGKYTSDRIITAILSGSIYIIASFIFPVVNYTKNINNKNHKTSKLLYVLNVCIVTFLFAFILVELYGGLYFEYDDINNPYSIWGDKSLLLFEIIGSQIFSMFALYYSHLMILGNNIKKTKSIDIEKNIEYTKEKPTQTKEVICYSEPNKDYSVKGYAVYGNDIALKDAEVETISKNHLKESDSIINHTKPFTAKKSSKSKTLIPWVLTSVLAIICIVLAFSNLNYKNTIKELLKVEPNIVVEQNNEEYLDYWSKNHNKVDFMDQNIVFVIEGYGNYYYTYDEMMALVGNSYFTYWAYNKEAAIYNGYVKG